MGTHNWAPRRTQGLGRFRRGFKFLQITRVVFANILPVRCNLQDSCVESYVRWQPLIRSERVSLGLVTETIAHNILQKSF